MGSQLVGGGQFGTQRIQSGQSGQFGAGMPQLGSTYT